MRRLAAAAAVSLALIAAPAAHAAPDEVIVADPFAHLTGLQAAIIKVDPTGAVQTPVSVAGNLNMGLYGMDVYSDGTIVAAANDGVTKSVMKIDPATGVQTVVPGTTINDPRYLKIDVNGDVLLVDQGAKAVLRINPNTGAQGTVTNGAPLDIPRGIAIKDGIVYISDSGATPGVYSVPASGGVAATPVSTNGLFAGANIQGMGLGPDGNLYVAVTSGGLGRVIRVNPSGGAQDEAAAGLPMENPQAVAFTRTGDMLVTDSQALGDAAVLRVNLATKAQSAFSANGVFSDPRGIYVDLSAAPSNNPPADKAIEATFSSKKTQKLKSKSITIDVSCPKEACTVDASGNVSVPKTSKSYKLKKVTKSLKAGEKGKLKLKLSKKLIKAAKRALKKHKKVTAKIKVTATDAAKNSSTKSLKVKLKR